MYNIWQLIFPAMYIEPSKQVLFASKIIPLRINLSRFPIQTIIYKSYINMRNEKSEFAMNIYYETIKYV